MPRLLTVIGTRPQYIKYAALWRGIRSAFDETLADTGQHYDYAMAGAFVDELALPRPGAVLDGGGGHASSQLARMLDGLHPLIDATRPDLLLCFGDTVSTLAAAVAAAQHGIPLAHVEAGERSRDAAGARIAPWSAPEEMHRVTTDHLSSLLLCATAGAARALREEHAAGSVVVTGDIMYDLFLRGAAEDSDILRRLGLAPADYLYCTVHRQRNTADAGRLRGIFEALSAGPRTAILPLHPRTRLAAAESGLLDGFGSDSRVRIIDPVGYRDSITLARHAYRVVTDSGGLTREAYFCGVPSVCIDDSTAWHVLCDAGWCTLTGADPAAITAALERGMPAVHPPLFGHGDAAENTVRALREFSADL